MRGELVPVEQEIYDWIEEVFNQGIRRPGYPADEWTTRSCLERFEAFGLENVRLEPVELPKWEPRRWSLSARSESGAAIEAQCFPLPHCTPTAGVEAPLVPFDAANADEVRGKIALYEVSFMRSALRNMRGLATWTYDPLDTFAESAQVLPFGREIHGAMDAPAAAGAIGFVGVLADYPIDGCEYYVPYDAVERPIPGVWVSRSDGAKISELLASGPCMARIEIDALRETITTHNVVGELEGADDEIVIIGSHHDGPWSSAVEDGSGIALVLAQARYWSGVPKEERPHRLVFLLNSGHMAGGAGCVSFCESHEGDLQRTVLEMHLEHAANEFARDGNGIAPTGLPETRWWFTSRIPALEESVRSAIEAEELDRSLILPPTVFGPRPTTDGGEFHLQGVPIVNCLTAPFYLFDAQDTMDKIHRPSLVPVTRAAIRIVESTAGVTAAEMRGGVIV
jgi:hypothetical protein